MNQGVGLLDGFPDLGRPELGARNTSSMGRAGMATSHSVFNYENPYEDQSHFDPSSMRYGKEPPNIFDRLRSQENYSDYMFSDSGSLSSISSWGRRSPTRSRKQRIPQNKASNSYSMNDINFHQVKLQKEFSKKIFFLLQRNIFHRNSFKRILLNSSALMCLNYAQKPLDLK